MTTKTAPSSAQRAQADTGLGQKNQRQRREFRGAQAAAGELDVSGYEIVGGDGSV
jgi:hypothetical protein